MSDMGMSPNANTEACPVCRGTNVQPLYARPFLDRHLYHQEIHRCGDCGSGIAHPRLTESEAAALYDAGYSQNPFFASEDPAQVPLQYRLYGRLTDLWAVSSMKLHISTSKCFPSIVSRASKILDYGAGDWSVVDLLIRHGYDAYGYDVSAASREAGLRRGRFVEVDEDGCLGRFAALRAYHVIEHLTDPASFLMHANRLLQPGGELCLATPNFDSSLLHNGENGGWFHLPYHRCLFSKRAIQALLDECGFSVRRLKTRSIGLGYVSSIVNGRPDGLRGQVWFKARSVVADLRGDGDSIEISAIKRS